MIKITVNVDGMQCGMCEAHINDAVRNAFPVKKVVSSHSKKRTVILAKQDIDDQKLRDCINGTGYIFRSATREPYEEGRMFSFLKKS